MPRPLLLTCALVAFCGSWQVAQSDTLSDIQQRGELIWGADSEGGGPYVYPDATDPSRVAGFEVELAAALARELGVRPRFRQCLWETLPAMLKSGEIDIVLNGFELTPQRAAMMAHTKPYFIYELVLLGNKDSKQLKTWRDVEQPPPGKKWRLGVLVSSAAHHWAQEHLHGAEIVLYEGNTEAMREVETGKLDLTLVDSPVAAFYRERFSRLRPLGKNVGRGYYAIFLRAGDDRLREALNGALLTLARSGTLKQIYTRYNLWSETEQSLPQLIAANDSSLGIKATELTAWEVLRSRGPLLLEAAGMTILLACVSMPLAMLVGLFVALGRLYGPLPLKWILVCYVELLRGTPLALQLFFIYFMLPELAHYLFPDHPLRIPAYVAAIAGLAINYSAYEAEIYRAGLQAVPRGQMEAALSLGMSQRLALRRIIVPQAARIVIPPVTNDFIALFKDTSVCSVISVVELTNQYRIQTNDTGATIELAALTAALYLLMSLPLAHLASRLERRHRRTD